MRGLPHGAPFSTGCSARHTETPHVGGRAARASGVVANAPPLAWRSCANILWTEGTPANSRHVITTARRSRSAAEDTAKDPLPVSPVTSSAGGGPSPGGSAPPPRQEQQQQQQQQQPPSRRRQFGPEPPPSVSYPAAEAAAAAAAGDAGEAPAVPKRRGRPPKQKADPAKTEHWRPSGQTVPLADAAAAVAAAAAAATAAADTSSGARRPFGPEPPPSPPPPTAPLASEAFPFALPDDPSQLNADDILDLPLPDPRVGETFRLDGDLSDLGDFAERLGEQLGSSDGADNAGGFGAAAAAAAAAAVEAAAAAAGGGAASGDDADVDADLDYDQLIALASRVDAASYVARAFERAKQGLDPVPDPTLSETTETEVEVPPAPPRAPPPAAAAAPPPRLAPPPPSSRPSSSSTGAVYVDDLQDDEDEELDGEGEEEDLDATAVAEAEAAAARRVALLVDLLSASGAELEAKLEAAAPEVDEALLALLERRYTAALALRQDAAASERIATLYRALRYMYERRSSSAAERLLDDVLGILADEQLQPDPARRRGEAAARLRNAFTGGMLDVDVFTAAAALAEGRQAAAEALAGETVALESFKAEATGLLDHARRVQQQTVAALEEIEAEVARLRTEEPGVLEGREWKVRLEQARLARVALAEREEGIAGLEEVLALTRAVELQMLTGRMEEASR